MNPHFDEHGSPPSFWRSRYAIGLVVIGGIAVYFCSPSTLPMSLEPCLICCCSPVR